MTHELEIIAREENGIAVVRAIGQINIYNSNRLKSELRKAISEAPRGCVVDLAEVPTIDSSGIGALVVILTELGKTDRRLVLCCANESVRGVFATGKLMDFFKIFSGEREAIQSLS